MTPNAEPAVHPAFPVPAGRPNPFLTRAAPLDEPAAPPIRSEPGTAPSGYGPGTAESPPSAALAESAPRRLGRWRPARLLAAQRGGTGGRVGGGALRPGARVRASLLTPRPDVFPRPAGLRGVHAGRVGHPFLPAGWFLLAAHGGAGAGLLSRLSSAAAAPQSEPRLVGCDAGQLWPDPALESTGAVVVVTRTTVPGLTRARDLAAQYLAGAAPPGTALLGVVLVADQPGKPPTTVARSIGLLDGVFARTWLVPYVPEYRLIAPDERPAVHPLIADVLGDIRTALTSAPAFPSTEGFS